MNVEKKNGEVRKGSILEILCQTSGWSEERAQFMLGKARLLGISSDDYVNKRYWELSSDDVVKQLIEFYANDNTVVKTQRVEGVVEETFDNRLVINGEKQITLRKICNIMGIEVPERFKDIQDEINNKITTAHKRIKEGSIYFIMFDSIKTKSHLERAIEKGAKVIFIDREKFKKSGLNANDYPVIFMDDKIEQVGEVFSSIRDSYNAKVLAITGTVGKTTSKKFIDEIVSKSYNTFASAGNLNSHMAVSQHLVEKLDSEKEVYIQEIGAGAMDSIRKAGRQLKPDGFVLLNVKEHHLNTYGTYENLFADKSSVDDYLREDGVVFANYDDKGIAEHQFKHRVVSFGIETEKDVDYRAINVVQNKGMLEFDVVSKEETVHIKIEILGTHNVYNALAAFVVGKWLNISTKDIQNRFAEYRSTGIRQNFRNIGGRYLYVDCYNVCEDSILATIKISEGFDVDEANKRIAFVGGENKLGIRAAEMSKACGERMADSIVDDFVLFGTDLKDQESIDRYGDAYSILEGLEAKGNNRGRVLTDIKDVEDYIRNNVKVGDFAFFKAIYLLDTVVALDKALGTSFAYNYDYYSSNSRPLEDGNWNGRINDIFGEAELLSSKVEEENVVIPETLAGYPLFRIRQNAFKNKGNIKTVDFGKAIKNIGSLTFYKCVGLTELHIPANVKVIEAAAFRGCVNLEKVYLAEGVNHIAKNVFRGNTKLKEVHIPASVGNIEANAFASCPKLIIHCPAGSFAEKYAKENAIKYVIE